VKFAVAIREGVHYWRFTDDGISTPSGGGGGGVTAPGGGFSGPLIPHPAPSAMNAQHTASVAARRQTGEEVSRNIGADPTIFGTAIVTTESAFITAADAVLATVGRALDDAQDASDADIDWSINEGILTIECPDGSKVIVNRHVPNREIWVAARSGGFHFRADGNRWRDTRGGGALEETLIAILAQQAGLTLALPPLLAA
jgi:CyaY protein